MPRGGPRPGAGAKPVKAPWLNGDGLSPLDILLEIMRNPEASLRVRLMAAIAAAPYRHRKLAPETARKAADADQPMRDDAGWAADLALPSRSAN